MILSRYGGGDSDIIILSSLGGYSMALRRKRRAVVDESACVACGCCVKVCPLSAIRIRRGIRAEIDGERCVGCGKCAKECPASVIEIQEVLA